MKPYYQHGDVCLYCGDARIVMPELAADSVDSIVTDPPYHLTTGKKGGSGDASVNLESPYGRSRITTGFMGKKWDGGDVAFQPETWVKAMRVLKPGGYLLAFGGTRTYHRLACAIEDAGFEIRDQIGWVFGSGFPKSHNLKGEWEGWGTALKPAWEPICVARKPFKGTVAENVTRWGVGAINIAGCRIDYAGDLDRNSATPQGACTAKSGALAGGVQHDGSRAEFDRPELLGRWPANIIHDGSDEVLAAFPDSAGQQGFVGERHGDRDSVNTYGDWGPRPDTSPRGDSGSAARFFYCSKASREDRNEGCEEFPESELSPQWDPTSQRGKEHLENGWGRSRNAHPTVKPTDLMRYLCRLVTPPNGTVLDMFLGSGSTGKAALYEGFKFIGIEGEEEYCAIAKARMEHVIRTDSPLFRAVPEGESLSIPLVS